MTDGRLDLVIVGAGPAGLAAAERARHHGLNCLVLERSAGLAATVQAYQKGKHVMAEPARLPLRAGLPFAVGSREAILAGWQGFAAERGLAVRCGEEVTAIAPDGDGFRIATAAGSAFEARRVVIAVGTQGNPRKLGAPGEDLPHVAHRLVDPAEIEGEGVVVVGAGDAALEVALALAGRNRVSLVVRGPEIVRAKEALEREIHARAAAGDLAIHFSTSVRSIASNHVELAGAEADLAVPASRVFLMLGAVPPRKWLEGFGVRFAGEGREARPVLDAAYQSSVPGLHLIGAVTGRDLIKLGINQGWEVVEHVLGRPVEPADEALVAAALPFGGGTAAGRIAALTWKVPLFAAADPGDLRELFLSTTVREPADGEAIVRQNDYTGTLLVVVEGEVEVRVQPEGGGAERRVAVLGPGAFFGEMSLISNRRRNATAVARGGCRLIEVPRKAMLKLLAVAPAVAELVDRTFLVRAIQGYLFPEVADRDLWPLVARAAVQRVDKGRTLFAEGDPADALYLIRSGMVAVSKRSGEREIVLSYLVAGKFFGEVAILPDARRTATVTTIFPTELIRLERSEVAAFLAGRPDLARDLLTTLETRRIASLKAEATPGAGSVLTDLIREEVVIATDALLIDDHKCIRCENCIRACEGVHDDGQARLSLTGIRIANLLAPNSCWQCENPLCMLDCPPDAIVRNARGEVQIKSNCIGCGNCAANCPYDNIFMVHERPKRGPFAWLADLVGIVREAREGESSGREVAVKCDLCAGISGGPACVRSCPTGAAVRLTPDQYQATLEEMTVRQAAL